MKSAEKVENVVKPPQKPTQSNHTAIDELRASARKTDKHRPDDVNRECACGQAADGKTRKP